MMTDEPKTVAAWLGLDGKGDGYILSVEPGEMGGKFVDDIANAGQALCDRADIKIARGLDAGLWRIVFAYHWLGDEEYEWVAVWSELVAPIRHVDATA